MFWTTIVLSYACFVLNFCGFGVMYASVKILPKLHLHIWPASMLILGGFLEVPGKSLAMLSGWPRLSVPRKKVLSGLLGLMAVSAVAHGHVSALAPSVQTVL